MSILVTGATGNIGREVVKQLKNRGVIFKAAVRDQIKAKEILGSDIETVKFDFENPDTYIGALKEADRLFLILPGIKNAVEYMFKIVDSAKIAGVRHIVFISILGADKVKAMPHSKVEAYIKFKGIEYTFLRPTNFMQNFLGPMKDMIIEGELWVPTGKGKMSFIDVRDIAEAAVKALTSNELKNNAWSLTSKEAYNFFEIADVFSKVLGRPIRFSNPSVFKYRKRMKLMGAPKELINRTTVLYLMTRFGKSADITEDAEKILMHETISFERFIRDYTKNWN